MWRENVFWKSGIKKSKETKTNYLKKCLTRTKPESEKAEVYPNSTPWHQASSLLLLWAPRSSRLFTAGPLCGSNRCQELGFSSGPHMASQGVWLGPPMPALEFSEAGLVPVVCVCSCSCPQLPGFPLLPLLSGFCSPLENLSGPAEVPTVVSLGAALQHLSHLVTFDPLADPSKPGREKRGLPGESRCSLGVCEIGWQADIWIQDPSPALRAGPVLVLH